MHRPLFNKIAFRHLPKHVNTYLSKMPIGPADGNNFLSFVAMSARDYKLFRRNNSRRARALLADYPCFDLDTGDMILDAREDTVPRTFTSYPLSTIAEYDPHFFKAYNFEWNRKSDVLVGLNNAQFKHWCLECRPETKSPLTDRRTWRAKLSRTLVGRRGYFKGPKVNSRPQMVIEDTPWRQYPFVPSNRLCHADFLPRCDCGCEGEEDTMVDEYESYENSDLADSLTSGDSTGELEEGLEAARESSAHLDLTEAELAKRSIDLLQHALSMDMFSATNEDDEASGDWWVEIEQAPLPIQTNRAIVTTPLSERGSMPGSRYVPKRSSPLRNCLDPEDFELVDESDASEEQVVNYWF